MRGTPHDPGDLTLLARLSLLKLFCSTVTFSSCIMGRTSRRTPNTPFEAAAADVYEVQAIEAKRRKGGTTEYFVLWKDHQPSDNTWEPMCNLTGSERLVNLFEKEWQEKYDAAEANALERRRTERIRAQAARDSPLEQAQHINRVSVSAATERRAQGSTAGSDAAGKLHPDSHADCLILTDDFHFRS